MEEKIMIVNKTKRYLELASAIIMVVWFSISIILTVVGLVTSIIPARDYYYSSGGGIGSYEEYLAIQSINNNFITIMVCNVVSEYLYIVAIVLGGILCKNPYRNNGKVYLKRNGLTISSFIFIGLLLIAKIVMSLYWSLHTAEVVVYMLCIIAMVGLRITAMCLKPFVNAPKGYVPKNKNEGYISVEKNVTYNSYEPKEQVIKINSVKNESVKADCVSSDTPNVTTKEIGLDIGELDAKVSELKHLKELCVLSDVQLKNAVNKLVKEYLSK